MCRFCTSAGKGGEAAGEAEEGEGKEGQGQEEERQGGQWAQFVTLVWKPPRIKC